ncbi:hypothetical protein LGH70_06155 [Hymenobacter sp. BT635]|uniref:Uncharacterized protein n=1 Tax=Hymenobacter nitidus TaxID=2880929 RepID=A0ABS8A9T5_9BACT|nr:hypothetical protein [Hymenobacter nitidus]MCB2377156.1 hypothetical protein [Hymenobacter nitidus]
MRLFDWVIDHLYWLLAAALVSSLGVWLWEPTENQVLKKRVVAAIAPADTIAPGDSLTINMARVANFPWDTLYVFCGRGASALISQAIGQPWRGRTVGEDDNLLVFLHQGEVADFVIFRGFNYQQEPHFVKFIGHFNAGELFTPATATFIAKRDEQAPHFIDLYSANREANSAYRPAYGRYLAQYREAVRLGTPFPHGAEY